MNIVPRFWYSSVCVDQSDFWSLWALAHKFTTRCWLHMVKWFWSLRQVKDLRICLWN